MLLTEYRLDLVIQALRTALKMEHPADAVLRHFFQAERIGSNERALVAETVFGVLRHRLLLEHGCTMDEKAQATARRMALAYWVKFGGYCRSRPSCRNGSWTSCARNTATPTSSRWAARCSKPPRSTCA
jgi:hypothetical protein